MSVYAIVPGIVLCYYQLNWCRFVSRACL